MQESKKGSWSKTKKTMMGGFERRVLDLFSSIKNEKYTEYIPQRLPVYDPEEKVIAFLRPLNQKTLFNQKEINLLAKWRKENSFAFPSQFKVTREGTKRWLENQLLRNPTRILFFIEDTAKKPKLIGHIGLYSFDFRKNTCEIDNVVRGAKDYLKGVMTFALKALIKWVEHELSPKHIFLRVFSDNDRAITFYRRCGFVNCELIPLRKLIKPNIIVWEEDKSLKKADKYFLQMILKN